MTVAELLDVIEQAEPDRTVSGDAMRWSPPAEPDEQ